MKEYSYSLFWIKPDVYRPKEHRDNWDVLHKKLPDNPNDFIAFVKKSLTDEGLIIDAEKETELSKEIAGKHYEEFEWVWCDIFNENKFDFLLDYMTSWKSYWIVFSWNNAIKKGREVLINIREEYFLNRKKSRLNLTHASDSIESAQQEIHLHFPDFSLK